MSMSADEMDVPRAARPLEVLSRRALAEVAAVDPWEAERRWRRALAVSVGADAPPPALVSLLSEWSAFSGRSYPEMLTAALDGQEHADRDWAARDRSSADNVTDYYNETHALLPLLLWWHGTDLTPAHCAYAAAAVFNGIGARRVLDFGCGIGSTSLALAGEGLDVVLSDVSREVLEFAVWRFRQRQRAAGKLDLSAASLDDEPPGFVDGVVAYDVFEHLQDVRPAVHSLDRVLAPGGALCFNQVWVPENRDEPEHFPQCGEVLVELHRLEYRLAHVPTLVWVAQKASLSRAEHLRQGAELRARIKVTKALERRSGPIGRRVRARVIRRALA